jgi:hypothetical protein
MGEDRIPKKRQKDQLHLGVNEQALCFTKFMMMMNLNIMLLSIYGF